MTPLTGRLLCFKDNLDQARTLSITFTRLMLRLDYRKVIRHNGVGRTSHGLVAAVPRPTSTHMARGLVTPIVR